MRIKENILWWWEYGVNSQTAEKAIIEVGRSIKLWETAIAIAKNQINKKAGEKRSTNK